MLKKVKSALYKYPKTRKRLKNVYYDWYKLPKLRAKSYLHYGDSDIFDIVLIETTSFCNFKCEHCPNSKYNRGVNLMDEKLFYKIIDELSEKKYNGWILFHFFGEPLTDKRIYDFVKYSRKKLPKATFQINTNGSLLNKEKYDKLIDAGVDQISVTEYKHLKVIDRLKAEIPDTSKIHYKKFYEDVGMCNFGGEVEVTTYDTCLERTDCTLNIGIVPIDWKGDIHLCCNDYHGFKVWGNVGKENIFDIWKKPEYRQHRKDMFNRKYTLGICKKCVGLKK